MNWFLFNILGQLILTSEDEILRAEILWALKCVASNYSFQSNKEMNNLFNMMFPDSKIAQGYEMSETKTKYIIQFGIAKYIFEQLTDDVKNLPIYI